MNTLSIKDYTFPVDMAKSYIHEYNLEQFGTIWTVWDLWVQTGEGPFADEGTFSGNIRCEQMLVTQGNLRSIIGKTIEIKDAYDYVTDEHLFTFYMLRHEGIKDNEITFEKIVDKKVCIHWKGIIEEMGLKAIIIPMYLSNFPVYWRLKGWSRMMNTNRHQPKC